MKNIKTSLIEQLSNSKIETSVLERENDRLMSEIRGAVSFKDLFEPGNIKSTKAKNMNFF